mgnify:CR=1 FL=1
MASKKKIPHTATVVVEYRVHQQMPDAFFNPMPLAKGSMLFKVDGDSEDECEEKVQAKLQEIKDLEW